MLKGMRRSKCHKAAVFSAPALTILTATYGFFFFNIYLFSVYPWA